MLHLTVGINPTYQAWGTQHIVCVVLVQNLDINCEYGQESVLGFDITYLAIHGSNLISVGCCLCIRKGDDVLCI